MLLELAHCDGLEPRLSKISEDAFGLDVHAQHPKTRRRKHLTEGAIGDEPARQVIDVEKGAEVTRHDDNDRGDATRFRSTSVSTSWAGRGDARASNLWAGRRAYRRGSKGRQTY